MNEHDLLKRLTAIVAQQQSVLKRLAGGSPELREWVGGEWPESVDPSLDTLLELQREQGKIREQDRLKTQKDQDDWDSHKDHYVPEEDALGPEAETMPFDDDKHTPSVAHQSEIGTQGLDWYDRDRDDEPLHNDNTRKTFKLPEERRFKHPMEDDEDVMDSWDSKPFHMEPETVGLLDGVVSELRGIAYRLGKHQAGANAAARLQKALVEIDKAQQAWALDMPKHYKRQVEKADMNPVPSSGGSSIASLKRSIDKFAQAQDVDGFLKRALNTAIGNVGGIYSQFHAEVGQGPNGPTISVTFTPNLSPQVQEKLAAAFYAYPGLSGKAELIIKPSHA